MYSIEEAKNVISSGGFLIFKGDQVEVHGKRLKTYGKQGLVTYIYNSETYKPNCTFQCDVLGLIDKKPSTYVTLNIDKLKLINKPDNPVVSDYPKYYMVEYNNWVAALYKISLPSDEFDYKRSDVLICETVDNNRDNVSTSLVSLEWVTKELEEDQKISKIDEEKYQSVLDDNKLKSAKYVITYKKYTLVPSPLFSTDSALKNYIEKSSIIDGFDLTTTIENLISKGVEKDTIRVFKIGDEISVDINVEVKISC